MPETTSNVELAHAVHERAGKHRHSAEGAERIIEIGEAILLAFVAIATAWSGYQAALWDGEQTKLYGESSRVRITATAADTRAGQEHLYDTTTFNFWLQAKLAGRDDLARAYAKRFRPEFRPAFAAWLRLDPFDNERAPPGPSFMPQYRVALAAEASRLNERATEIFDRGTESRSTGEKYVRTTVLLATVLFLIAVSQRFRLFKVRVGLLVVGLVLLTLGLGSIASYPRL